MHYMLPHLQAPLLLFVIQVYFLSYRNIVVPSVNVDSLCDRISLVRSVSLKYCAIHELYVASFASPSSSLCYPGIFNFIKLSLEIIIFFVANSLAAVKLI